PPRVFTREAAMLLHERARGIPRTMNVLADNALLAGFARGQCPMTRAIVEEVSRDFSIDAVSQRGPSSERDVTVLEVAQTARPAAYQNNQPGVEAPPDRPAEPVERAAERKPLFASFSAKSRFPFLTRKGIA